MWIHSLYKHSTSTGTCTTWMLRMIHRRWCAAQVRARKEIIKFFLFFLCCEIKLKPEEGERIEARTTFSRAHKNLEGVYFARHIFYIFLYTHIPRLFPMNEKYLLAFSLSERGCCRNFFTSHCGSLENRLLRNPSQGGHTRV